MKNKTSNKGSKPEAIDLSKPLELVKGFKASSSTIFTAEGLITTPRKKSHP